jgi:hypothetical protein
MKRMGRTKLVLMTAILFIVCLALLVRIDYDQKRDVWAINAGAFSFTCLDDHAKGMACWVYWDSEFLGHWPGEKRPPMLTPYPTYTPYPTSTPYPTPIPEGWQSA